MKRILQLLLIVPALGLLGVVGCGTDAPEAEATGVVHRFVIPAGTGERVDRGEAVDVMPSRLEIDVGDTVEIVNDDDRGHNVGLFFVGEGETVSQTFPSAAEFSDVCSVSATGEFTIVVS